MGSLKKESQESKKKLTPEQNEKLYQILKHGLLMRLDRKGLLKKGALTKH